jgi:hypothetical protein
MHTHAGHVASFFVTGYSGSFKHFLEQDPEAVLKTNLLGTLLGLNSYLHMPLLLAIRRVFWQHPALTPAGARHN